MSLRFLKQAGYHLDFDNDGDMDADDVRLMPRSEAIKIYRERFWRKAFDALLSQDVATKVFDTSVNMGHPQAGRIFQRAIVACGGKCVIDGAVGPATVAAANKIPSKELLAAMRAGQARFYTGLVQRKPTLGKFLRGWLRRAAS